LPLNKRLPRHFYTSKNFRIFFIEDSAVPLKISVPKKLFKTAVCRNKIKRRIKEVFRLSLLTPHAGGFLILVYESFLDLSFKEASVEIVNAVKSKHN